MRPWKQTRRDLLLRPSGSTTLTTRSFMFPGKGWRWSPPWRMAWVRCMMDLPPTTPLYFPGTLTNVVAIWLLARQGNKTRYTHSRCRVLPYHFIKFRLFRYLMSVVLAGMLRVRSHGCTARRCFVAWSVKVLTTYHRQSKTWHYVPDWLLVFHISSP